MTISAADDPYLGVLSEFDAATTPAPPVNRRCRRFSAGVVSKAALAYRREHRRSRRASVG